MGAAMDREAAANRVFRYVETFHAYDTSIPWERWFNEKPGELGGVLSFIQQSESYHTYCEHFLAGMPHWDEALLMSEPNIAGLQSFAHVVQDETWHALGRREDGVLIKALVEKIKDITHFDLSENVGGNAPRAAGVCLYTGHIEQYVHAWRSGEDSMALSRWCKRASKHAMLETWTLFSEMYPDAAVVLVHHTRTEQATAIAEEFEQKWLLAHPEQHEALYAFLHHGPHVWGLSNTLEYGTDVAERAKDKSALMLSLFPEVKDAEAYLRTYAQVFFQNDATHSLPLPEELTP